MSFFQFGIAQEGGVDSLLANWDPADHTPGPSSTSSKTAPLHTNGTISRRAAHNTTSPSIGIADIDGDDSSTTDVSSTSLLADATSGLTLEQLLEEDDLLQECKNSNAKLLEFLSTPSTVKRILDYVTGEAFEGQPIPSVPTQDPDDAKDRTDKTDSPALTRAHSSTSLAEKAQRVLSPKISPDEKERNRKRLKYPYLCTEILVLDPWQVSDTIFSDPDQYLMPFWNSILDKKSQDLAEISVHAGHWAKVNMQWLSGPRVPQYVQFLQNVPDLFPRMLVHLPYISPIFDVLVKIANIDDTHPQLAIVEWLKRTQLVSRVLDLLDPVTAPLEAHAPASDFLRSLVAAASAAVAVKQQQQQQEANKVGDLDGSHLGFSTNSQAWSNWPDNKLVRDLASQATIERLLGYMLDVEPFQAVPGGANGHEENVTPEASATSTSTLSSVASNSSNGSKLRAPPQAITSSLLNSMTVIIDIIRKNNSDFTELQIFHFLGRSGAGSDSGSEHRGLEGEGEEGFTMQEQGPSLVDLEPMLRAITRRLPDIHNLLTSPRSDVTPRPTNLQGTENAEPLSAERYRVCELYAELLHCSNMAILNRSAPASTALHGEDSIPLPSYDPQTGRIQGTRSEAFQRLNKVLNANDAASPDLNAVNGIHDEGVGEDSEAVAQDIEKRPVTADSVVTSSYESDIDTVANSKDDSADVFDNLNDGLEDLSIDSENGSQKALSAQSSPMPPSTATFGITPSSPSATHQSLKSRETSTNFEGAHSQLDTPSKPKVLAAGPALKKAFIDLHVVPTVLDLFFRFPWNNFLHNVVYDLIQQIFNGRLEEPMNRDLCIAVFSQDGGLIERVLEATEENKKTLSAPRGVRLGNMGHLTLITEEVVKLFYNSSKIILPHLPEGLFESGKWEAYIENTFKETRDRDLQPLGGGISVAMHASASTGSGGHGIGIVEMDDEFPQGGRAMFSADQDGSPDSSPEKAHFARYLASQLSADFQGPPSHNALNRSTSSNSDSSSSSSDEILEDAPSPVSRRQPSKAKSGLDGAASAWFSPREGDSAFDDYDDDDDESQNTFGGKHKWHEDFDIGVGPSSFSQTRKIHDSTAGPGRQDKFGFDDRSDPHEPTAFASAESDEDEDDFGPFSDTFAATPSPGAATATVGGYAFEDNFGASTKAGPSIENRPKLTPADWNSSFRSHFDEFDAQPSFGEFGEFTASAESPMASPNGDFQIEDDDDFGDFASSDVNSHGDYDFSQADPPVVSPPVDTMQSKQPAVSTSPSPKSPTSPEPIAPVANAEGTIKPAGSRVPPPVPPSRRHRRSASSIEKEHAEKTVTSPGQELHGPGLHEGAHISQDGKHVEVDVDIDGKKVTVQVPKDELTLHPDLVED